MRNCSLLFASVLYKNLLFSSAFFFWGGGFIADAMEIHARYIQKGTETWTTSNRAEGEVSPKCSYSLAGRLLGKAPQCRQLGK